MINHYLYINATDIERQTDRQSDISTNIPQNDMVASLDLSSGGAQCRQIPWHAGYVTPYHHNQFL